MQAKYKWLNWLIALLAIVVLGMETAYAAPQGLSMGEVATNMLGPLGAFTDVIYKICYILGAALIVGGAIQYKQHRDNPTQIPISRPLLLLLFGLLLIGLPFIAQLSESASAIARK